MRVPGSKRGIFEASMSRVLGRPVVMYSPLVLGSFFFILSPNAILCCTFMLVFFATSCLPAPLCCRSRASMFHVDLSVFFLLVLCRLSSFTVVSPSSLIAHLQTLTLVPYTQSEYWPISWSAPSFFPAPLCCVLPRAEGEKKSQAVVRSPGRRQQVRRC